MNWFDAHGAKYAARQWKASQRVAAHVAVTSIAIALIPAVLIIGAGVAAVKWLIKEEE
jgi:hypothetical protein